MSFDQFLAIIGIAAVAAALVVLATATIGAAAALCAWWLGDDGC